MTTKYDSNKLFCSLAISDFKKFHIFQSCSVTFFHIHVYAPGAKISIFWWYQKISFIFWVYIFGNEKCDVTTLKNEKFSKSEIAKLQHRLFLSYLVITLKKFYPTVNELQPSELHATAQLRFWKWKLIFIKYTVSNFCVRLENIHTFSFEK